MTQARTKNLRGNKSHYALVSVALASMLGLAIMLATPLAAAQDEPALTDIEIRNAVENELIYDPAVDAMDIAIEVVDGTVTLDGTVTNILAKERAADHAMTVRGVTGVINQVRVSPEESCTDNAIENDVAAALLRNPATESYELSAMVDDGTVTLRGTVDSWQEQELAMNVAKGVRGVKRVNDDIEIEYTSLRPDSEIESEVQQALQNDIRVDNLMVDVSVDDAVVHLSGTVGSAVERSFAVANAYVAGADDVKSEELDVARWARDEALRDTKYEPRAHSAIAQGIERALIYDARVMAPNVDVDVNAGVATLRGTVESAAAERAALNDARNTVGVIDVCDRLDVMPADQRASSEVETDIRTALAANPYTNAFEIKVEVDDGVARLSGEVDTFGERAEAHDIAANVRGVTEVRNKLTIDAGLDPYTYDPYVDTWYPGDYDWYTESVDVQTVKVDWRIKEEIESELWWSPFVESDDVTVVVDDGTANLVGAVESWNEYWAAEENAFEGGAIAVDNDILVEFEG